MATKKADEQKPKKVQLEFWSYWLSCGFAECELENLCADELDDFRYNADICGSDIGDLGGTLTVDGEAVSVDFSQAAQECEGMATDWNEYLDTCGTYFIDVDKASQCAEVEIDGDFDPKKLTLFYRTAIYPGHKRLKILTGVSYGGESLEIAEPDEFNGKGVWYWVFDDNKYTKLSSSEDIEGFQPEDRDWKQFPGVTKPETAKKSDPNLIYAVENESVVIKGIRKGFHGVLLIPSQIDDKPVTSIEWDAFADCSGLTSVTIPDCVTEIGYGAFKDCSGLTSVTIPDSVTEIGDFMFYGCIGLTSVTIPDGVTRIGTSAFCDCSNLTSVTIPDSVTSIEYGAFSGCSGLTSVTIPKDTEVEDEAFDEDVIIKRGH